MNWTCINRKAFWLAMPAVMAIVGFLLVVHLGKPAHDGYLHKVLIISSQVPHSEVLANAAGNGVLVVRYDASKESPQSLLEKINAALLGRKASTMALAMESQGQGAFNLTSNRTVSLGTLLVDKTQQEFFRNLGKLVAAKGRIDVLACDFAAGEFKSKLIRILEELTRVGVAASSNTTGNVECGGDWVLEIGNVNVASLYFKNDELKSYTGLLANPEMVKDIYPGSNGSYPSNFRDVNNIVFFVADNGTNGAELWKSDGTLSGTVMVKDINPGSVGSYPGGFINVNGIIYFSANDGTNSAELWKSDGTAAGTVMVKDINPGGGGVVTWAFIKTSVDDTLYFCANDGTNGWELWRSDGTSGGTVMVKNINPGGDGVNYWTSDIFAIGNIVYFAGNDGTHGIELWKTDGSITGTAMVKDIYTGGQGSYPRFFSALNDTLYFGASDSAHGMELWKSGGTTGSTVLVKDICPGTNGSYPMSITNANGVLYFNAYDATNGFELWKSDGTTAGTNLVKDINPGSNSGHPMHIISLNGLIYFAADDGTHGWGELFKSDGTSDGTVVVKDINPGASGANIDSMVVINNKMYFGANDGTHGKELWESDGSIGGTVLVKDIWPGPGNSSYFLDKATANGTLYISADDSVHGRELWIFYPGLESDNMMVYLPDTNLVGSVILPGDTVNIPVYLNPIEYNYSNGIYSFQTTITYNDSLFQCIGYDSLGTVLSNRGGLTEFTVKFRKDSGRGVLLDTLRIAGASDDSLYYSEVPGTPFAFPRPLIKLKFRIPATAHNGDSTVLHFSRFMFNEGIPASSTDDGSIKLRMRKKGDVDKNGIIQPIDAILVLRYVIHDTTLDAESQIAAEVSNNGEISAYDAALILMYWVGKITTFPAGEYYKQALPSNKGADVTMEWGEVKDGTLNLLVKARHLAEVYGYSLAISYDPSVLTYQGYQSSDWTKGRTAVVRNENGQLRMAVAGVDPLNGEGEIVMFKFKLNLNGDLNREKLVNLNELVLNEEALISNATMSSLPKTYSLEQNYPNPFNPETRIRYQILEARQVQLIVYNLLGQPVRTLINEMKPAGAYEVKWDGKNDQGINLASGVYIYRIKAGNFINTRKLILMK